MQCGAMRGDAVQYRESFGSVESVKAASDVYAPVDGEVLEVNDVRDDPFHYIDHQTAGTRSRHNPSPYPSSPPTPRRMLSACTQDRSSFFFIGCFGFMHIVPIGLWGGTKGCGGGGCCGCRKKY